MEDGQIVVERCGWQRVCCVSEDIMVQLLNREPSNTTQTNPYKEKNHDSKELYVSFCPWVTFKLVEFGIHICKIKKQS
jgi:hypothetical protein